MDDSKKDLKELQKEINSLRSDLKRINEDKESWFKKKEDLKGDIADLISKVKDQKKISDTSSDQATKLIQERNEYNKNVKKLIENVIALQKEKKQLLDKYKIEHDPEILKKNIEKLEEKIETEALSIDAEKRLMDRIKRLKKYYGELGGVKLVSDKIGEISKEIEETKTKANEAHYKLKELMKEKKSGLSEFFNISRQINIIKKQQERAFEMFISLKNNFINVSRQLNEKLNILNKTKQDKQAKEKQKEEKKRKKQLKIIEEKTKIAQEKMKRGEKLTTEDLLVLQNLKDQSSEDLEKS